MQARILVSVGAWVVGAGVATTGTLMAVSLIGQGINSGPVRTLSDNDIASALAVVSQSPQGSPAPPSPGRAEPSQGPGTVGVGTRAVLASEGGTIVATCGSSGVYLSSWSPAQDYWVDAVVRGPGPVARVLFESSGRHLEVVVECRGGVPTAVGGTETSEPGDS